MDSRNLKWVGEQPSIPGFNNLAEIKHICDEIREQINGYLFDALRTLVPNYAHVAPESVWQIALFSHRYGSIYWVTREESRLMKQTIVDNEELINQVAKWGTEKGVFDSVFNLAVVKYVFESGIEFQYVDRFIPPRAFQALGSNKLFLHPSFPRGRNTETPYAFFDLHDFAHLAACRVNEELYRCYLHEGVAELPPDLIDLVAAPGFVLPRPTSHADGYVFSHLLSPLFHSTNDQLSESDRVQVMAEQIAEYLMGRRGLYSSMTQTEWKAESAVSLNQLAVLVQNKAYELPASEIEQWLFVRGGVDGLDSLEDKAPAERLLVIGSIEDRTFHEARNTLKHRAHHAAYCFVVSELQEERANRREEMLLEKICASLTFSDPDRRPNLFREVANNFTNNSLIQEIGKW